MAIKWFIAGENGKEEALRVLDAVKESPRDFAVPELFFNEMLSVFCRLLDSQQEISDYMETLQEFGMMRIGNGRECLALAIEMAKKYGLSGYDAIYASNAKLVGGVWLTADKKAHQKISSLNISRCLEF
ncbi:MAG: type II toxin-antitoxin system VapC family toxin [Deltaproteobacteria bacterium]|nr:type II toxin-antitoxin system VapC family toxin [Deltaproteobacteria bacterium]